MKKLEIPTSLPLEWGSVIDYPKRCQDVAKYLKYHKYEKLFDLIRYDFDMNVFSTIFESFIQKIQNEYGSENVKRVMTLIRKGKLNE